MKRLRLNRETVRLLARTVLVRVRGGFACSDTCGICDLPRPTQDDSCLCTT